ncbi:hypothetical protein GCM10011309_23670 [Litorimonas cladophorae]|uniref:Uncharacterized protein n=1 Tax=Litorimonas cladophorae TaxID=1220491 RepID=A0A918KSG8_9PROT|nr:hypothetical protein [Litorimonas cladophorae]GGX72578.1 hypothetical protein GCM10011309_23670 [Litorimonas cladophorae]
MNSVFKAVFVAFALTQIGCVKAAKAKTINVEGTDIALLTNDLVIPCDNQQLNSEAICVKLTGLNIAEKAGKMVAYGLMLDEAGWTQVEPPLEEYVSTDALMTPAHVHIIYQKRTPNNCAKQIKISPIENLKNSNTLLAFSASTPSCTN